MECFHAENFSSEFEFYGKIVCLGCAIPSAMRLRENAKHVEKFQKEMEENVNSGGASQFLVERVR
jgi:hypothetical protein